MRNICKQPVLHFLGLGALLFVVFDLLNSGAQEDDPGRILLDDARLLEYVQYRNRAFNNGAAQDYLAGLSEAERTNLVQRLVREEVLYREAKKLGLDRDDYIIKQRLVQKMEYLAQGFAATVDSLAEADIERYYRDNQERYREQHGFTFTHVFVNRQRGSSAHDHAVALLSQLNRERAEFSQASRYGDRFLYHSNYVERSLDSVASHFGAEFTQQLGTLDIDDGRWQGPLASSHGWHLVMVVETTPGGVPPLATIQERVNQDAQAAWLQQQRDAAIDALIATYRVDITTPQTKSMLEASRQEAAVQVGSRSDG